MSGGAPGGALWAAGAKWSRCDHIFLLEYFSCLCTVSLEGVIDHTMVPTQAANMLQSLCRAVLILEAQSCIIECRQDNDSGDADRAHAAIERRCPGGWAECARQLSAGTRCAGLLPATGPLAGPPDRHRAPSSLRQAEGSLKALSSHGNDERASRHAFDRLGAKRASYYESPPKRTCRTGCGVLLRLCHAICKVLMCRSESSCTPGIDTSHMLRRRSVTYAPRFHYDPGETCSMPDDAFTVCRRSMCPGNWRRGCARQRSPQRWRGAWRVNTAELSVASC